MSRRLRVFVIAICAWALVPAVMGGQSTGPVKTPGTTILGTVVDASLNALSGAVVTLERDGKVVATTTSGNDGAFTLQGVAAGSYRVKVERSGFPALIRDLKIPAGAQSLKLPIVLSRPQDKMQEATKDATTPRSATVAGGAAAATPTPTPTMAQPPPPPAKAEPPAGAARGAGGGGGGGGRGGVGFAGASPSQQFRDDRIDREQVEAPWSGYRYAHTETYAHVPPNRFQSPFTQPLSTFGADVDTASYANVRRFLTGGQLPPRDAVRVEEFVNYFRFNYDAPTDGRPIAITTEVGDCPWAPSHKLVLIGARAKTVAPREVEGRNIVLLLDVSGSMAPADRLPLIQNGLRMFVDTLQPDDRLAIVTYAGTSGLALPSTPARYRDVIQRAIASLYAGGSTNGGQGLVTAYRVAREQFIPGGVNRVILATDGDFNVGIVNQNDLLRLIERERNSGVFLSVLGVGTGNLRDSTMELLADKGNGHYAYLDSLQEAHRVLVREGGSTVDTVAKDVKFQVEFNPAMVGAWKLIGYENRVMAAQDFNDDRKDGGEMGAGHTVTVLYEVIPAGVIGEEDRERPSVDPLRYQTAPRPEPRPAVQNPVVAGEWLTVKTRYKAPEADQSQLMVTPVRSGTRVRHLPVAAAIAEFGLLLRDDRRDDARWDSLVERSRRLQGAGISSGDLNQFADLVAMARAILR